MMVEKKIIKTGLRRLKKFKGGMMTIPEVKLWETKLHFET